MGTVAWKSPEQPLFVRKFVEPLLITDQTYKNDLFLI